MADLTLTKDSLYGSEQWCATTLGKSIDWWRRNRSTLEGDGFPPRDPLTNQTIKADVIAWINKRRKIEDHAIVEHRQPQAGVNLDAL